MVSQSNQLKALMEPAEFELKEESIFISPLFTHNLNNKEDEVPARIAFMYARYVLNNRWEIKEHLIMKSPYYSALYDLYVANGEWEIKLSGKDKRRFDHFKNIIPMSHPTHADRYASGIIINLTTAKINHSQSL